MIAYVFQKYPENFAFQLFIILHYFLKVACFLAVSIVFSAKENFKVHGSRTLKLEQLYECENCSVCYLC